MDVFTREVGAWAASQLEACTRCGICAGACPFYLATGKPEYTPIYKLDLLRRAYQQESTLSGKLKAALGFEKRVTPEDLTTWRDLNFSACSICNRCSLACPMGLTIGGLTHQMRHKLAEADNLHDNLRNISATVQRDANLYGYPSEERAAWVEYMDDPPDDLYLRPKAEVVYFVGCLSSFSPRPQRIAEACVKVLTAAQVDFTILGEAEQCCGFPLRAAGLKAQANELIARNIEAVKQTGAKAVVFTCPGCRMMWREEYAPALPGVEMLHVSEFMAPLLTQGRLELAPVNLTVTYHDPCDLARNGGVFEPPRQVLDAIPGLTLLEVSESRESGLCCGGGGDVEMVAPENVRLVSQMTAGKLFGTGAEMLATACPQCMRQIEEGAKAVKPGAKVLDIIEIVAQSAGLV